MPWILCSSFLKCCAYPEYLGNFSSFKTQFMHHLLWKALLEDTCTRCKPPLNCSVSDWEVLVFSQFSYEWTYCTLTSSTSEPGLWTSPCVLSPYGNGYLKFCLPLTILHSLCVRETGSHRQTIADSLGGILWTIVVVLFFLGTWLCFWKMYKRERNMDTRRGKLHFFFLLR